LLEPMFFDLWDGLQPVDQTTRESPFVFTLASTKEQLKSARADDYRRIRIRLDAPSMPTTALYVQEMKAGSSTRKMRSTENQIFSVISGRGVSEAGDERFEWERGDTFVVPTWNALHHQASQDALLFCVSDLPVHEKLGFLRVQAEE
jgi:gentisate 1,2-dioxygenase